MPETSAPFAIFPNDTVGSIVSFSGPVVESEEQDIKKIIIKISILH